MKTKYDELAELAEQASPGIWSGNDYGVFEHAGADSMCVAVPDDDPVNGPVIGVAQQAWDMRYIAAANPVAVLGLIADVKALAEALKTMLDLYDDWEGPPNLPEYQVARAALKRIQGEAC